MTNSADGNLNMYGIRTGLAILGLVMTAALSGCCGVCGHDDVYCDDCYQCEECYGGTYSHSSPCNTCQNGSGYHYTQPQPVHHGYVPGPTTTTPATPLPTPALPPESNSTPRTITPAQPSGDPLPTTPPPPSSAWNSRHYAPGPPVVHTANPEPNPIQRFGASVKRVFQRATGQQEVSSVSYSNTVPMYSDPRQMTTYNGTPVIRQPAYTPSQYQTSAATSGTPVSSRRQVLVTPPQQTLRQY